MKKEWIKSEFIFIVLLLITSWLYGYHEILFHRPYSVHTWRQADCLSITTNYYKENLNFFTPEVHWIGDKGHGKTISEFPVIYFTVAQFWKIFGQKEFIFRLINILIVFSGLFSLFKLTNAILKDSYWSIFVPLFLFTSPLLIYYTNNFLSNAPAFGLALTGLYLYYLYDTRLQKKWLIFSIVIFTFAGLIKITSLIIFVAILAVTFFEYLLKTIRKEQQFKNLLLKLLPFGFIFITIVIWYIYARHYNQQNHSNLFLQDIFPVWELTTSERKNVLEKFYRNLLPTYFNKEALLLISVMFLSSLVAFKKANKKFLFILGITFLGIGCYFLLWFQAFDVHDYYLINLLIFIPLTLIVFLDILKKNFNNTLYKSIIVKSLFSVLILFLIIQGAIKNRLKYSSDVFLSKNEFWVKKSDRDYWDYIHWDYANNFEAFETIKPYLRSIGISRTDKIICMSDASINISLYFMDQKGLTKYGYGSSSDEDRMEFAIQQGCKYLIINDRDLKNETINPFLNNKIGQYENIHIYRLQEN